MAEAADQPALPNPFDQIDPNADKIDYAPTKAEPANDNPFDATDFRLGDQGSTFGAFRRGAQRALAPAIGSLPAIGVGVEAGEAIAGLPGAIVGGLAGGFLGSTGIATVQNWAVSKLSDSWKDALGLDDRQERIDQGEHPTASLLGGLTPYMLTMRPGAFTTKALPENATAFQRIMAHPATARLFGGAAMGGMELGQEAGHGESPDWTKVAISTGFGLVFNQPTRIGESLIEAGAGTTRRALGRPDPATTAAPVPSPQAAPAEPVAAPETAPAAPGGIAPTLFHGPTVAQAGDLKVMGPGITEDVFQGAHEQAPAAAMTAQEAARTEQATLAEPPKPDVHDVARRMEPDLFADYDALTERRDVFAEWIASNPDNPPTALLARTEAELGALEPRVAAAYRRAAEATGAPSIEPTYSRTEPTTIADEKGEPADPSFEQFLDRGKPLLLTDPAEVEHFGLAQRLAQAAGERKTQFTINAHGANYPAVVYWKPGEEARAQRLVDIYSKGSTEHLSAQDHREIGQLLGYPAPEIEGFVGNHTVDVAHDVRSGAVASKDTPGLTYIDPRIPEFSPTLKDKNGQPANLHKYLTIHEQTERTAMANGMSYADAHSHSATPAERAAVEADGVDWNAYTHEMDGYLAKIEHENVANPPPDPHVDPNAAVSHHISANKTAAAARPIEAQKAAIAQDVERQLVAAGRPAEEARSAGALIAARYAARASRFNGMLGTAEDLYKREGAQIRGPRGAAPAPAVAQPEPAPLVPAAEAAPLPEPETIHVGPKAARGPRAVPQENWSLLQFLADRGGISPDEKNIGDVRHLLGTKNKFIPGFGNLIRPGGMTLDRAREAAVEAKYMIDAGDITGGEATTTTNTLLDAMDRELRGDKQYRVGYQGPEAKVDRDEEHFRIESAFHDALRESDVDPKSVPAEIRARTIEIMAREGERNPLEAYDRAVIEDLQNARDKDEIAVDIPKIAGWNYPPDDEGRAVSGYGEATAGEQTPEGARAGEATGQPSKDRLEAERELEWEEFYQRKRARDLIAEREAQGQMQIPGAERVGQGELAQRKANEPLRPGVEQKPADEGLFGDAGAQKELFQDARGKIRLMEGRRPIITLMRDANASTFIHETGHQWLEELMRDASHEAAPQDLKADADTVQKWLGVDNPADIKTSHHEKFARGFEQYMREGIAPSPELVGVFARFKAWLINIYQTLKGLGQPINNDIRRVFDRMLTQEPQRTVIAPERERGPTLADIHEADAAEIPASHADAGADLIATERARYTAEPPADIRHEIDAATAQIEAERTAGAPAQPSGEAGSGSGGLPEVVPGGGEAGVIPGSGGVGEGGGAIGGGRGEAAAEGAGAAGPQQRRGTPEAAGNQPLAPSPAASLGPRESPFLDKAGNIRVENLTTREDVAQAIHDAADENDDFIGDRRGVVTDGQVMELADALGMDFNRLNSRKIGQAFNAEQIMAARKLLIQSAETVGAAMKKAATGTDQDVMAYALAKDRHQLIQGQVAGITAEAGRALRAFRDISMSEEQQNVDQFIKGATGKTLYQLRMEAKLGAQLDSPAKVSKFLNDARNRSFGGMVLEYWINGLISGVATHVTYMQGNLILAMEKALPETAIAAAIGSVRRAAGREGDYVRFGEVGAQLRGVARGLPGSVQAFLEAMRTGMTTLLPGETARPLMPFSGDAALTIAKSITDDPVKWQEVGAQAFGMMRGIRDGFVAGAALLRAGGVEGAPLIGPQFSPLGQIPDIAVRGVPILPGILPGGTQMRIPGRAIAAIHSFFRSLNYSMSKSAEAYRAASQEGLTGTAFDARVGEIWQNPSPEIMERSRFEATELTLMGQGGEMVKALSRLTNATVDLPFIGETAPLKFIDPFVHIGSNIIKQAIVQRTPAGILSAEIRADLMGKNGNIAQDMAAARMLAGTSLGLLFGGLAMQGYASGSGPKEPAQQAMWRLAGNQAHSVRIGDIWYDVHRLGPMGMLLGVSADMYDVAHEASKGDLLLAGAHLQHAITQNILDESFMRGPADLIKAIEDPGRYGESYIRNFLSSFVPFSVGVAQMARAGDPYSRQARTVMDSIKAKIPGLSETLWPRRDIWGEELPNPEALGRRGLTAVWERQVSHDPVNVAMLNLGIAPAKLERKIRNVDLTEQQYDDYARIAGRMTKMRLDAIVRSPDYQTWPNHIRHDVIAEVIRQSREAGRGMLMMKYPSIAQTATQQKRDRVNKEPQTIH